MYFDSFPTEIFTVVAS